jgi:hypothetical protein
VFMAGNFVRFVTRPTFFPTAAMVFLDDLPLLSGAAKIERKP